MRLPPFPRFSNRNFHTTSPTSELQLRKFVATGMPTYGGITVVLQTQYDALPIPEYAPPPPDASLSTSTARPSDCSQSTTSLDTANDSTTRPPLKSNLRAPPSSCASSNAGVVPGTSTAGLADSKSAIASSTNRIESKSSLHSRSLTLRSLCPGQSTISEVPSPEASIESFVPIYYGAQFWIHYDCLMAQHRDEGAFEDNASNQVKYYYFKAFIGGRCVLSWGVGEKESWHGKVSFGIFDGGTDFEGNGAVERRAFFFPRKHKECGDVHGGQFDIRVYRSKARKREPVTLKKYDEKASNGSGFNVLNAGRVKRSDPKRMYTYALLDPVDEPYATFRYHLRSIAQLAEMGIDLSAYEASILASSPPQSPRSLSPVSSPQLSSPAPAIPQDELSSYRLSFPPRMQLTASTSTSSHGSPMKRNAFHNAELERHDYEDMMHRRSEDGAPRDLDEALERFDRLSMIDQFMKVNDLQGPDIGHGRLDSLQMANKTSYESLPATEIPDWVMSKPLPARPDEAARTDGQAEAQSRGALASVKGLMGSWSKRS